MGAATGGALLAVSAGVHVDLYVTGYDQIPTIGPLFLLQAATAMAIGVGGLLAALGTSTGRWRWRTGVWTAACGFAAATIAGYALSRWAGLFGFHEQPTTAGVVAGVTESAAFLVYGALAAVGARLGGLIGATGLSVRARNVLGGAVAVAGAVLLAVSVAGGVGSHTPSSERSATSAGPVKTHAAARSASVVHVVISSYSYHPARVTAHAGEEIAVTNDDQVTHTMTAVPGSSPYGGFNTGYVDPGRTVRIHAPKQPGVYQFYCSIHNFMKGVLVVTK